MAKPSAGDMSVTIHPLALDVHKRACANLHQQNQLPACCTFAIFVCLGFPNVLWGDSTGNAAVPTKNPHEAGL